jgi:hypothetical protein
MQDCRDQDTRQILDTIASNGYFVLKAAGVNHQ